MPGESRIGLVLTGRIDLSPPLGPWHVRCKTTPRMRPLILLAALAFLTFSSSQAAASSPDQAISFRVGQGGIDVVDVTYPDEQVLFTMPLAGQLHDLLYLDDRLFVARGQLGITVFDVTDSEHPKELFTFDGGGRAPVKLTRQKSLLMVACADGPPATYDLSQRDEPRLLADPSPPLRPLALLPSPPALPLSPAPGQPSPSHSASADSDARRLVAMGAVVLVVSTILIVAGGVTVYQSGQAAQAAEARHARMVQECPPKSSLACAFQLDFSGLGPALTALAGYGLVTVGSLSAIPGLTLVAVGAHRLRPPLKLRPAPLTASPLSDSRRPVMGASLELQF